MSIDPLHSTTSADRARRWVLYFSVLVAAALVAVWLIRVNQVSTVVRIHGQEVERIAGSGDDLSEIVILIDPARRAEGATVEVDGRRIAHPAGEDPGELVVDLSKLGPGEYELEIRAPRPSWSDAVTTVQVTVND